MKRVNKRSKYIRRRKAAKRRAKLSKLPVSKSFSAKVKKVMDLKAEHKFVYTPTMSYNAGTLTQMIVPPAFAVNDLFPMYNRTDGAGDPVALLDVMENYMWMYPNITQGTSDANRIGQEIFIIDAFYGIKPMIQTYNNNVDGTVYTNYCYFFEIEATPGQFGPWGSTLLANVGANYFSNWGALYGVAGVLNQDFLNNICQLSQTFLNPAPIGFRIVKVHKWAFPHSYQIHGEEAFSDMSLVSDNGRTKKVLRCRRKRVKFDVTSESNPQNFPKTTSNRLGFFLNDTPHSIGVTFNRYYSFTDV